MWPIPTWTRVPVICRKGGECLALVTESSRFCVVRMEILKDTFVTGFPPFPKTRGGWMGGCKITHIPKSNHVFQSSHAYEASS